MQGLELYGVVGPRPRGPQVAIHIGGDLNRLAASLARGGPQRDVVALHSLEDDAELVGLPWARGHVVRVARCRRPGKRRKDAGWLDRDCRHRGFGGEYRRLGDEYRRLGDEHRRLEMFTGASGMSTGAGRWSGTCACTAAGRHPDAPRTPDTDWQSATPHRPYASGKPFSSRTNCHSACVATKPCSTPVSYPYPRAASPTPPGSTGAWCHRPRRPARPGRRA